MIKIISLLLIPIILFAPVASALDHCLGMEMATLAKSSHHHKKSQNTDFEQIENSAFEHRQTKQLAMDCQDFEDCSSHFSGAYVILSTYTHLRLKSLIAFSAIGYDRFTSLYLSSVFRPPISIQT